MTMTSVAQIDQMTRRDFALLIAPTLCKARWEVCPKRLERAVAIVRQGNVRQVAPGTYEVQSQCQTGFAYVVSGQRCQCLDYDRAPNRRCKHVIAVELYRKVEALLTVQWHCEHLSRGFGLATIVDAIYDAQGSLDLLRSQWVTQHPECPRPRWAPLADIVLAGKYGEEM